MLRAGLAKSAVLVKEHSNGRLVDNGRSEYFEEGLGKSILLVVYENPKRNTNSFDDVSYVEIDSVIYIRLGP